MEEARDTCVAGLLTAQLIRMLCPGRRGLLAGFLLGLGLRLARGRVGRRHRFEDDPLLPLAEAGRLADAVAEVVQLGPTDAAGALDDDLGDLGRVERERPFNALAVDQPTDG